MDFQQEARKIIQVERLIEALTLRRPDLMGEMLALSDEGKDTVKIRAALKDLDLQVEGEKHRLERMREALKGKIKDELTTRMGQADEIQRGLDAEREAALVRIGELMGELQHVQISYFGSDGPVACDLKKDLFGRDSQAQAQRIAKLKPVMAETLARLKSEDGQTATYVERRRELNGFLECKRDPSRADYLVDKRFNSLMRDTKERER